MSSVKIQNISEITEGQEYTMSVTIGEKEIAGFVDLTDDRAPVHTDAAFATAQGYKAPIAHGLLVGSFYSTILGCHLPGPNTVITRVSLDMVAPVYVGDTLNYSVKVDRISEAVGSVSLALSAANQNGTMVSRGTAMCLFKKG